MADYQEGGTGTSPVLSTAEVDAIGEILNISMGSAATAISTMLDRQVIITTPKVEVQKFHDVSYAELEPAILVKIEYVEGISGSNVMVFRQSDMQIILNLLMGNDEPPSDDFIFDEMSMSAACEVMNQMMGASATALSDFLGKTINISTPEAVVMDSEHSFEKALNLAEEDKIISIAFNLDIKGVMNSDFISVMTCDLAKTIVSQVMGDDAGAAPAAEEPAAVQQPAAPAAPPQPPQAAQSAPPQAAAPGMPPQMPAQGMPQAGQAAMPGMPPQMPAQGMPQAGQAAMPGMAPQVPGAVPGMPPMYGYPPEWQQAYGQQGMMPPYNPYGYPPYGYPPVPNQPEPAQNSAILKQANVQSPKFPSFSSQSPVLAAPLTSSNMDLVMNVPLNVSVEIGKTKKKIRDIMDFAQGTVIELEKQAGAPVDIVVNGQLIARGDVVVVEDNFGVRITEIVGTKELIDSLENNN